MIGDGVGVGCEGKGAGNGGMGGSPDSERGGGSYYGNTLFPTVDDGVTAVNWVRMIELCINISFLSLCIIID